MVTTQCQVNTMDTLQLLTAPTRRRTVQRDDIYQIGPVEWEIPQSFRNDMRVPARFFASKKTVGEVFKDLSLEQLVNVTTLPGIVSYALAMPDMHQGYGFPIGGVAATLLPNGAVSPGGIGYDINCGVRLLLSNISETELAPYKDQLANELSRSIPSGTGRGGRFVLGEGELNKVIELGAQWAFKNAFATDDDLKHIESGGRLKTAHANAVSELAKKRGSNQLGTLGAGNHFIEVGVIDKIFDPAIAYAFGIRPNQVTVLVHTGSRGLGHQVATDYIRLMLEEMPRYEITIPDKELTCLPFSSDLGQKYFSAMSAAANYAWVNRQLLTHLARQTLQYVMGCDATLRLLYDVAHNIAKIEEYEVNGKKSKVLVQRKGATRAFGPNNPEIIKEYQGTGQPVIIPGSMGTASYVLAGTATAMEKSFGSTCHGAGRSMSRHAALKIQHGKELQKELAEHNIIIRTPSIRYLSEEAPYAYKDIDEVVNIVAQAGIAKKVARLRPLIAIKG